ncbi:SusC/RagA family TonB-linked outer membrane protein [Aquimarina algiphila]|uniref:SusC/RagA family TonB-linked outer membrane protein n=1 Tax=Aquimarina algiphila TaxID=2047982 RepID=UPI00232D943A|nr:TonB-dependent receptor [Aquimarina algiphila]
MSKQSNELTRKISLGFFFILFLGLPKAYSQQTISGTIVDENSQPIPGVNILVEGTSDGAISDFDGNYSISGRPEDVLVISYVGYITQRVTIGNQSNIIVKLVTDFQELADVVVIGYGSSRKKDLTGSVSTITSESYENQPINRVEEALQGRTSGVSIQRSNGTPGSNTKVRVRGVNSVTGNNSPLVVVDGVFGGDLGTINPNDIESINVLKDASALAIYGSRGSNGVILVNTKKGKGKTRINLETFSSFSEIGKSIDRLSSVEFARIKNQQREDAGQPLFFTDDQLNNLASNPIDYEDEIFRKAFATTTELSVSGGSDDFNYYLSGNYTKQDGILITNNYERYSLRSNLKTDVSEKLSIGLNIYASRETDINNPNNFNRVAGSMLTRALTFDPTSPVLDENGEIILESPNAFANLRTNPITALNRSNREQVSDRLNSNMNIKYKFTNDFSYNLIVGLSTLNQTVKSFIVDGDTRGIGHTTVNFINLKETDHQVSNILNYKKGFGNHNIDATVVYEFQGTRREQNTYSTVDVLVPGFFLADEGNPQTENFSNRGSETAIESYLGRVAYNFNRSLYLTGSLRIDQSSRFIKSNRTGYFPSAAIAYSFNNLGFIENSNVVSNLKIRAGWGKVGNQNILSSARFSASIPVPPGVTFDGTNTVVGERFSREGNPDITWETTAQTNLGLDLGLLGGRIDFSVDYFKKNTEDLLLRTKLPNSDIDKFDNVGEVENKGIDITLSADIIQNNNFNWNSSIAASYVENEVLDLIDGQEQIVGDIRSIDGTGNSLNVIQRGLPLGQFYGFTFLGTWKTTDDIPTRPNGRPLFNPGDPKYLLDENNSPVLSALGSGIPKFTWGFNNTITYKNWDFSVFVQGAHGFKVFNLVEAALNGGAGSFRDNLSRDALNAWTPENETDIPRNGSRNNLFNSSRFIEDGDFIRLSNLSIGYTLKNLFKGVETIKFYVSGQNLVLITDYSGYDPEVTSTPANNGELSNQNQSDTGAGINIGAIPNPRTYTLGVKLGF